MPTRITIAEDRAAGEPSGPPEGTAAHPHTPIGSSGSTLDLFTPKASASSPTPRFGLTRQAAKTLSSRHVGGRSGTRTKEPSSSSSSSSQYRDIVASPRLLGYLLNFIASLICMVSAIKFERLSQQQYWFDVLVYFSDGRIDQNLTNPNPDPDPDSGMNRSSTGRTRLLFAAKEEQHDFAQGPVASSIFEASVLYDVAVIVGGPEPNGVRLFNPYGVRLLQSDEVISDMLMQDMIASSKTDTPTLESTPPTPNPSASLPTQTPTSLLEEPETTMPTVGPTMISDLPTDAPTKGMNGSITTTSSPTFVDTNVNETVGNTSRSLAPTYENDVSTAAPTSMPTVANLTAILPITDEKPRPIRAVDYWKMRAAFILPAIGCSVTFLIIVAHFDSKYFPGVWREIFRDGSRSELYIICALIAFWIAGLYICTGIHSVGYVQANVFFSCWAAFATSLMGLKLWRESAGLPSLFKKLANHTRMTTYNWMWAGIFSVIMLFSLLDLYVHRDSDSTLLGLSLEDVLPQTWRRLWILTGVTTSLCLCVPLTNHYLTRPQTDRRNSLRKFRVIFRQVEGLILLGLLGMYAYIITRFTGVQSPINGINNPYLSTWGTFLCIVLCFSTWLRDKKNVAWVHAEGDVIFSSITPKKLRRSSSKGTPAEE